MDVVCRPASQPAVRPACARCRALKITQSNWLLCQIYETVVLKTTFPLRQGDAFVLSSFTLYSIAIGMHKHLCDHNIPYIVQTGKLTCLYCFIVYIESKMLQEYQGVLSKVRTRFVRRLKATSKYSTIRMCIHIRG